MKEELLHFIWRTKQFIHLPLQTTIGEEITIIQAGMYNTNAGPDFLNAKIRIGQEIWAGHIEMHLQSSDWIKHQHQKDAAYQNVILHVVLEEDIVIKNSSGAIIPCLVLKKHIPKRLKGKYQELLHAENWIACQPSLPNISKERIGFWLDRMVIERLEEKTNQLLECLKENQFDWETSLYHSLGYSFGLKVNADAFEALMQSIPLTIIAKHQNSLLQLEALLFGQAGMLEDTFEEAYPNKLKKEYQFLKHKYQLQSIVLPWKFMRLRPANFPSIRIAQMAAFLFQTRHLFSKILAAHAVKELENLFDLQVSLYWKTHYRLDKASKKRAKKAGIQFRRNVIINSFIPFLFAYAKARQLSQYQEKALAFLSEIPCEKNALIRRFEAIGMPKVDSAYQSQALLQLKKRYCNMQHCLSCAIGHEVLK
jgi:hypothetical protein